MESIYKIGFIPEISEYTFETISNTINSTFQDKQLNTKLYHLVDTVEALIELKDEKLKEDIELLSSYIPEILYIEF